jgi:hypothetical protein
MAIEGLTNVYQQQRQLPKLRLGFIDESTGDNGKQRKFPRNPDHFCFDPAEVPEVVAVYGEEPKEIHAVLVGNNINEIMPTNYQFYTSSGKNWFLNCSGDGKTAAWYATHLTKTVNLDKNLTEGFFDGKIRPKSYLRNGCGSTCPDYASKKCKETSRIRVMLPLVSLTTVYEIVTHSRNTIIDFVAAIQNAQNDLTFGRGMGLVFKLSKNKIEKQKMKEDKSGTQVHHFSYLTCKKDDSFWETHGKTVADRMRRSSGLALRSSMVAELGFNPTQIQNELISQVQAVDQFAALQAPQSTTETVDTYTGEIIEAQSTPVKEAKPAAAAQAVSSLETDEEVIFLVKTTYEITGAQMPPDGVKKAIARYGTKEKIKAELEAFIATKGNKKAPPLNKEKPKQAAPPTQPTQTSKPETTSSNDSLL